MRYCARVTCNARAVGMQAAAPLESDCALNPPPANWNNIPRDDHARLNAVFHLVYRQGEEGQMYCTDVQLLDNGNYCVAVFPQAMRCTAQMLRAIRTTSPHVYDACYDLGMKGSKAHAHGCVCVYVRSANWDLLHGGSVDADREAAPPPPASGAATYTREMLDRRRDDLAQVLVAARQVAPAI